MDLAELGPSALTYSQIFFCLCFPLNAQDCISLRLLYKPHLYLNQEYLHQLSLFCEQGVVDAIGGAAASALQGPIQMTYREAFQSTILPSFERACQNMFQQINDSFHKGTQQCMLVLLFCWFAHLFPCVWSMGFFLYLFLKSICYHFCVSITSH